MAREEMIRILFEKLCEAVYQENCLKADEAFRICGDWNSTHEDRMAIQMGELEDGYWLEDDIIRINRVHEFTTWQIGKEWDAINQRAIESAKAYSGKKFTVSIGEWGTTSYLVFADTKEEAKAMALAECKSESKSIKVRDVTNTKKWN